MIELSITILGTTASLVAIIQFVWGLSNWSEITFSRNFVRSPKHRVVDKPLFDISNYDTLRITSECYINLIGTSKYSQSNDALHYVGISYEGFPKRLYFCAISISESYSIVTRLFRIDDDPEDFYPHHSMLGKHWDFDESSMLFFWHNLRTCVVSFRNRVFRYVDIKVCSDGVFWNHYTRSYKIELTSDKFTIHSFYYSKFRVNGNYCDENVDGKTLVVSFSNDLSVISCVSGYSEASA